MNFKLYTVPKTTTTTTNVLEGNKGISRGGHIVYLNILAILGASRCRRRPFPRTPPNNDTHLQAKTKTRAVIISILLQAQEEEEAQDDTTHNFGHNKLDHFKFNPSAHREIKTKLMAILSFFFISLKKTFSHFIR